MTHDLTIIPGQSVRKTGPKFTTTDYVCDFCDYRYPMKNEQVATTREIENGSGKHLPFRDWSSALGFTTCKSCTSHMEDQGIHSRQIYADLLVEMGYLEFARMLWTLRMDLQLDHDTIPAARTAICVDRVNWRTPLKLMTPNQARIIWQRQPWSRDISFTHSFEQYRPMREHLLMSKARLLNAIPNPDEVVNDIPPANILRQPGDSTWPLNYMKIMRVIDATGFSEDVVRNLYAGTCPPYKSEIWLRGWDTGQDEQETRANNPLAITVYMNKQAMIILDIWATRVQDVLNHRGELPQAWISNKDTVMFRGESSCNHIRKKITALEDKPYVFCRIGHLALVKICVEMFPKDIELIADQLLKEDHDLLLNPCMSPCYRCQKWFLITDGINAEDVEKLRKIVTNAGDVFLDQGRIIGHYPFCWTCLDNFRNEGWYLQIFGTVEANEEH